MIGNGAPWRYDEVGARQCVGEYLLLVEHLAGNKAMPTVRPTSRCGSKAGTPVPKPQEVGRLS